MNTLKKELKFKIGDTLGYISNTGYYGFFSVSKIEITKKGFYYLSAYCHTLLEKDCFLVNRKIENKIKAIAEKGRKEKELISLQCEKATDKLEKKANKEIDRINKNSTKEARKLIKNI